MEFISFLFICFLFLFLLRDNNKFVKIVRNDFASLLRRPVKVKDTSYNVDSKSTQQKSLRVNLFSVCMISAIHTKHYFFSKKHKNQKAKFQVDFFAFALKKDEIREKSIQIESNRLDSTDVVLVLQAVEAQNPSRGRQGHQGLPHRARHQNRRRSQSPRKGLFEQF